MAECDQTCADFIHPMGLKKKKKKTNNKTKPLGLVSFLIPFSSSVFKMSGKAEITGEKLVVTTSAGNLVVLHKV